MHPTNGTSMEKMMKLRPNDLILRHNGTSATGIERYDIMQEILSSGNMANEKVKFIKIGSLKITAAGTVIGQKWTHGR